MADCGRQNRGYANDLAALAVCDAVILGVDGLSYTTFAYSGLQIAKASGDGVA